MTTRQEALRKKHARDDRDKRARDRDQQLARIEIAKQQKSRRLKAKCNARTAHDARVDSDDDDEHEAAMGDVVVREAATGRFGLRRRYAASGSTSAKSGGRDS